MFAMESIHGSRNKGVEAGVAHLPRLPKTPLRLCASIHGTLGSVELEVQVLKGSTFFPWDSTGPIKPVYSCFQGTLHSLDPGTSRQFGLLLG